MRYATFPAMGTTVEVFGEDDAALLATQRLFEDIERTCSRFRDDSELSLINSRSGYTVDVSPTMRAVLEAARRVYDQTGGLVDPAVGGRVADWGYRSTFEHAADLDDVPPERALGRWEISGRTLCRYPGTALDLGGIAKGWACDQAVERGMAVVVNAGGDVRSTLPEAKTEVLDGEGSIAAVVALGVGALATSSTQKRRWSVAGRPAHHIIDPRTGAPAVSPVASATVLAATAVDAEAGAKAALIIGEAGLAWADEQDWLDGAIAVWRDGAVYSTGSVRLAA
jgi:thiamine biosynthesis lipoprotein